MRLDLQITFFISISFYVRTNGDRANVKRLLCQIYRLKKVIIKKSIKNVMFVQLKNYQILCKDIINNNYTCADVHLIN